MSYIIKSSDAFVSIKLTEVGREKLAQGLLNFNSWAVGDSEINYNREAIVNPSDVSLSATSKILRPFDRQPNIKSFITPEGATTPFQPINASNLNVIKVIANNEAEERGFFGHTGTTFSSNTNSDIIEYTENVSMGNFTGGTMLNVTGSSSITSGSYVLAKITNNIAGSITPNENLRALPNLWFKVQNVGVNYIEVDRNLPNYSSSTATAQLIFYREGEIYDTIATGTTTAYWDSGTLSFDGSSNVTCKDVPVWNMNNVWCENLAGITGLTTTNLYEDYTKFGSFPYLGTKNPYLEYFCLNTASTTTFDCNGPGFSYLDDVSKSISIIHYTNNAISSLYGEFFFIDTTNDKTLKIYLPDLMYHRRDFSTGSGTTQGMTFVSSGTTKFIGTSDIEYIDLIEDPTLISSATTAQVVGKVFPQLKTVVIHDDEIVAALSYKSNRSWTLPSLSATLNAPTGTTAGLLETNKTMYLTYSLENSASTGLTSSLPCQTYIKVTNSSSSSKDVAFRISEVDLLPYMRKFESATYDGLGFYANKFKLLYQIVDDATDRPDPESWLEYDFTSTLITTVSNETIDPVLLENQTPSSNNFIIDSVKNSGATTFNLISLLNLAPNNQPTYLQFGDERFFYGNLTTHIGATIYKTLFDIRVNANQFSSTSNPTRSKDLTTNPPEIRVSEVGIYDLSNNLVCIGKLSEPKALSLGNTIMFELGMDF
jgi:hypothetical protein